MEKKSNMTHQEIKYDYSRSVQKYYLILIHPKVSGPMQEQKYSYEKMNH